MIFVTGDTHIPIDIHKLNTGNFPQQRELSKADYVIICGDFGGVWSFPDSKYYKEDKYWLDWLTTRNFTTLFVDGNHENFTVLNSYPIVDGWGGKVGKITDTVYHLMRGEVYDIDGLKFFCFGGATSADKYRRKEGLSWWPEEIASKEEMEYGISNLEKHNNTVDYIITHCCSTEIQKAYLPYSNQDAMTQYFNFIEHNVNFKHWYFGHYHLDRRFDDKHTCMYNFVEKL